MCRLLLAAVALVAPRLAASQTPLPVGANLNLPLSSGTPYSSPSGCFANFSIAAGTGGNAVASLGGAGAAYNFSVPLYPGVPIYALFGIAAQGCSVTYCSSGGGAAAGLLTGSLAAPLWLAVAGGGGGSSTTVTQIGGNGGPPGGSGVTGTSTTCRSPPPSSARAPPSPSLSRGPPPPPSMASLPTLALLAPPHP